MGFRIEFLAEHETTAGYLWHRGHFVIGEEQEPFVALIADWRETDYERQWLEALTAIVDSQTYSFLVTTRPPVRSREMYVTWPLARSDDAVAMRNVLLPAEGLADFDPADAFEGPGSEWRFSVRDVEAFLREHGV